MPSARHRAERGKGRPSALSHIWPFLHPHRGLAISWLIMLLSSSVTALAFPALMRRLLDHGFKNTSLSQLDQSFLALFGLAIVLALTTAGRYFCITLLGERTLADLRVKLYAHVIRLDIDFFERSRVGELISRLGSDTEVVQALIGSGISVALRSAVMLLGATAAMIWTSPRLAGLIALVIPAVMLPIVVFGRKVQRLSRQSQDRLADAAAIANETLNAASAIKAYGREATESAHYRSAIMAALATAGRRISTRALLTMLVIILVFGAMTVVLWAGARQVVAGQLEPGVLGQFVLYAVFAAGSVAGLSEVWGDVLRAAGAMERIGELMAETSMIKDPPHAREVDTRTAGELRFMDISFHYPSRPEQAALSHFDLHIRAGETVALVGPSGAGKSTVLGLLLRFYDPQQGAIQLDGIDLRDLRLASLRGAIALVPQEAAIFAGSVEDNLRFGRAEASSAALKSAATAAAADAFIEALPQSYQTALGEHGVRLSGGQKQRLAIARAILRDAPLLLLDEATSALDARSEAAIQSALERAQQGRTTLIIAHRLATVKRADRIIVMDAGRIVAQGTHAELMQANGLYADLARLQFIDSGE